MADALEREDDRSEQEEAEPTFEVGETVVVREDFHSKYYRGMPATVAGPARKGGTSQPLWPLKIEKPPYEIVLPAKYFVRKADWKASRETAPSGQSKKPFLSRVFPWRR